MTQGRIFHRRATLPRTAYRDSPQPKAIAEGLDIPYRSGKSKCWLRLLYCVPTMLFVCICNIVAHCPVRPFPHRNPRPHRGGPSDPDAIPPAAPRSTPESIPSTHLLELPWPQYYAGALPVSPLIETMAASPLSQSQRLHEGPKSRLWWAIPVHLKSFTILPETPPQSARR